MANVAYYIYLCKFWIRKVVLSRKIVSLNREEAIRIIENIHPDINRNSLMESKKADKTIDLSIIVPIYNYANLIENNINSILNQETKYSYELILVDDGSTDGARDIVRNFSDNPQVHTIFQENQGIAGARNTGISAASGKYIMFVDCDDIVENYIVEKLMSKAYDGDYDIVMCAHNLVKERDGEVFKIIPNIYPKKDLLGYPENAYILNFAGLPWGKVYKRELWDNVRFFSGYWYEDTIIHSLLFTQCKKFAYIPDVCYQYRWYDKNFSHIQGNSANPRSIETYWLFQSILKKYVELKLSFDDRFEIMLLKHLSAYYYSKINQLDENVVEALFVLACDLYHQYGNKSDCKLPYMLRMTKKSFIQHDINLWKLSSKYQR